MAGSPLRGTGRTAAMRVAWAVAVATCFVGRSPCVGEERAPRSSGWLRALDGDEVALALRPRGAYLRSKSLPALSEPEPRADQLLLLALAKGASAGKGMSLVSLVERISTAEVVLVADDHANPGPGRALATLLAHCNGMGDSKNALLVEGLALEWQRYFDDWHLRGRANPLDLNHLWTLAPFSAGGWCRERFVGSGAIRLFAGDHAKQSRARWPETSGREPRREWDARLAARISDVRAQLPRDMRLWCFVGANHIIDPRAAVFDILPRGVNVVVLLLGGQEENALVARVALDPRQPRVTKLGDGMYHIYSPESVVTQVDMRTRGLEFFGYVMGRVEEKEWIELKTHLPTGVESAWRRSNPAEREELVDLLTTARSGAGNTSSLPSFCADAHARDRMVVFEGERQALIQAATATALDDRLAFLSDQAQVLCWGEDARLAVGDAARQAELGARSEEAASWAGILLRSQCGNDAEYELYWRLLRGQLSEGKFQLARLLVRGLLRLGCRWEEARLDIRTLAAASTSRIKDLLDAEVDLAQDPVAVLEVLFSRSPHQQSSGGD